MRADADKYSMVAGDFLSSGAELRLPLEQPWPEQVLWKDGKWERVAMSGFNVFKLMNVAEDRGYKSPFWLSLRDGEAAGGKLKEGAVGANAAGWRWREKDEKWKGDISPENVGLVEPKTEFLDEGEAAVAMRPKVLFNAEQWEGIGPENWPVFVKRKLPTREEAFEKAQRIEEFGAGCEIRYGGTLAYYNPTLNYISLPPMEQYNSPKQYFWALFEQIGHALASKHQMDLWSSKSEGAEQGSPEEELGKEPSFKAMYAKMTAAMLAYETGIDVLE